MLAQVRRKRLQQPGALVEGERAQRRAVEDACCRDNPARLLSHG